MNLVNRVIIVRHAHRDVSDRADDNGLSPKGWRQAHEFAVWFKAKYPGVKPAMITSPKLRCRETLEPLADLATPRVDALLDEQHAAESHEVFLDRIRRALASLRLAGVQNAARQNVVGDDVVIACSHGDWIPVAIEMGWAKTFNLGKGQWIELDWNN